MARASRRERTRHRLLSAARDLLERVGPAYVGLSEVAAEAGVTRQTVYEHFGSRSGLLLALVDWVDDAEDLPGQAERIWGAATGAEALERFAGVVATMTPRIHAVARAIHAERGRDPAAAAAWEDRMEGRRSDIRRIVEWIESDGRLAPGWSVDEATDWAWALTGIALWEQLVLERGWPARRYEAHLAAALRRDLVAPGPP